MPIRVLAAVIRRDGRVLICKRPSHKRHGDYPAMRYERRLHRATELIQVCDAYDALRTRRSFRDPWPLDRIVSHLRNYRLDLSGVAYRPLFS